uniref:PSP proline-rich domain-containing protein n=1 Tax=Compsopogon caeruleus TaxID=31354 RepID=A0A6T6D0Q9_9RHOD
MVGVSGKNLEGNRESLPKRPDSREDEETRDDTSELDEREDVDEDAARKRLTQKLTRRQRKEASRIAISRLKALVPRPDVVEQWDNSATDPFLLTHIKSLSKTVPVPSHWRQKRAYLQNKRGMEKRPFVLPAFIQETGIGTVRDAYHEMEKQKSLKQQQRDRIRPKMGKTDIDYQILHDAFFKFQTPPTMTRHGQLYYELKELEPQREGMRPGVLSPSLRAALGMEDTRSPPPWLINMQRNGPPPAYPNLKIPGLNAPIPPGASFGYQPGGWGKPPVDANGFPLFGDVLGTGANDERLDAAFSLPLNQKAFLWGSLAQPGDDMDDFDQDEDANGGLEDLEVRAAGVGAEQSVIGMESTMTVALPEGLQTPALPEQIDLRKRLASDTPIPSGKNLYQVLEPTEAKTPGPGLLQSRKAYKGMS